jgi:hypothetical protein
MKRSIRFLLVATLLAVALSGCGPSAQEVYTDKTSAITVRWIANVERWEASPGDPAVVTDFIGLMSNAQQIEPPADLTGLHQLFTQAMRHEMLSYETYATGDKKESDQLHQLALDGMEAYQKGLRERDLIK